MNHLECINVKATQRSALHFAASCGSSEVCRAILRKGGNPNLADKKRLTPAHDAAAKGHFEVNFNEAFIKLNKNFASFKLFIS